MQERDHYQSLYHAATTQQADADQKLTDANAQLQTSKDALAAAKTAQETAAKEAADKLKAAEEALTAANGKSEAAAKDAADKLKAAQDACAAAQAKQTDAAAQCATLTDKVAALQKQVDTLTADNDTLKAALAKAQTPATKPAITAVK